MRLSGHLSVSELASRWGVSKMTLRRWRDAGFGPGFIQVGNVRKKTFYPIKEVERYEQGDAKDLRSSDR